MEDIDFLSGVFLPKIQKNCKILVWNEKYVEPWMYSHCQFFNFSILKMWKIKNVFTLGQMA